MAAKPKLVVPVLDTHRYETITVTPELAEAWLMTMKENRSLRPGVVEKYAVAMANDDWQMNGSMIRFGVDDDLKDGQHRCWACIESGKPFRTLVGYGFTDEEMMTVDTNVTRSVGDLLKLGRGIPNGNQVGSTVRLLNAYEKGTLKPGTSISGRPLSAQEVLAFYEERQGLMDEAIHIGQKMNRNCGLGVTAWAGAAYVHGRHDLVAVERFFDEIVEMQGKRGQPTWALAKWAQRALLAKPRPLAPAIFAVTVSALNYYRRGEEMQRIQIPEQIPRVWQGRRSR